MDFYQCSEINSLKKYLLKKAKKLLFPFYIYFGFYLIFSTILHKYYGFSFGKNFNLFNWIVSPWTDIQPTGFCMPSWFVITIFIIQIMHACVQKTIVFIDNKERDIITAIAYILIGAFVFHNRSEVYIGLIVNICKALMGLFFYEMGFLYGRYFERYELKIANSVYFIFILLLRCIVDCFYGWGSIAWYELGDINEPYFIMIISALLGILFWLRIARIISNGLSRNSLMIYLGKHTYSVMLNHLFVGFIFQTILGILHIRYKLFNNFDLNLYKTNVYYVFDNRTASTLMFTMSIILTILGVEKIKDTIKGKIRRTIRVKKLLSREYNMEER